MSGSRTSSWKAVLALAGAVVLWGASFSVTKSAFESFKPMTVIWLRMVVASIAVALAWRWLPKPKRRPGDERLLAIAILCIPCLYYLFEGYAVVYTTSGQAGMISAILPLMVGGGAWLWWREPLGWRWAAAIAASLLGVGLLSWGSVVSADAPNAILGNALEVGAMASAAGSMLIVKRLSERYSPWILTALQPLGGLIFFAPWALPDLASRSLAASPTAWGQVVFLGLGASLGAFGLYNFALSLLPAGRASLAINLVPVVALLAGWVVRGETLTSIQLAGAALIGIAVATLEMPGMSAPSQR